MRYRITSLAVTPRAELAVDAQLERLGLRLQQRLRGQHVLDFARADAERQRAERAVRRRVAVAADDRHAGLRVALLRADDVDDALRGVVDVVQRDAELVAVVAERVDLLLRDRVENRQAAVGRRHIVVDGGERALRPADLAAGEAQAFERLRAGDFVHEVQVDVQNRLPARLVVNDVLVPDFFKQRAGFRCSFQP